MTFQAEYMIQDNIFQSSTVVHNRESKTSLLTTLPLPYRQWLVDAPTGLAIRSGQARAGRRGAAHVHSLNELRN